ncbi:MAG: farnesyl-diphosphate synthase [Sneathiella sp.]|jgi:farnesyl diphosphate synthase|uniref:polyprenyl synthetase family protein n=1 Tax=Sneathiella sp. TaxID=1964365 RepID=UPI000C3B4A41|nr:farnesyl diphosphate synthase [Sneathiella sp.]MAL78112.1 farnesyl-diphosphate synthase [Sneathiella sp.]
MEDDFSKALRQTADLMDKELRTLLPVSEGLEKRLFDAMRYAVLSPGKRLRAFLLIQSADLFAVPRLHSVRVAAALEMVHSYSLIHDDLPCMDDDDLRRGLPTVHKKFDEATAVLAGDALQSLAFEIVSDADTHPSAEVRIQLAARLARAIGGQGMVGGQVMDIHAESNPIDMATITRLQRLKTGALISFACVAGGILGHASPPQLQALKAYAHDLGLAFQIADDILDEEGTAEEMGKATGKDAAAGKATFVSLMGLEDARVHAAILVDQAIDHLDPFGPKADLLRHAAHFAIHRRN